MEFYLKKKNPSTLFLFLFQLHPHTTEKLQMLRSSKLLGPSRFAIGRGFQTSSSVLQNPKSPMQVFYETFRTEWKKSDELKNDIKALQDESGRLQGSEAFQKAKEAYDRAQKGRSAAEKAAQKTAEAVGTAAYKAWSSPAGKATRNTVHKTAEVVDRAIDPVRQTKAYKEVSSVIDDGSASRYGGFETKEERRLRRERELQSGSRPKVVKSDEEAGNALVVTSHKPQGPTLKERMKFLTPQHPVGRFLADLRIRFDESENGLVSLVRTVFEKIGNFFFTESESAKVIRAFREIDPSFRLYDFHRQLREYIVPEVLDAYIKGDEKVLKLWLSEAPFNVVAAQQKQFKEQGLFSDGKILDIRGVDVVSSKLLPPNNVPVLVVGCRVQEINLYRKAKTGEVAAGTEENIMMSSYAMVLTRIPEEVDNKETDGWKVVELVRGASRQFT